MVNQYLNLSLQLRQKFKLTRLSFGLHNLEILVNETYLIMYCILIYISLLAVHTSEKRFQCEKPRENRAVKRGRKEALGSAVNKVDRIEGKSWFQNEG